MFLLRLVILSFLSFVALANDSIQYQPVTIAFYNVENLFDTVNSVDQIDGFRDRESIGYHIAIPYDKAPDSLIRNPRNASLYKLQKDIRYVDTQDQEYTPKSPKHYDQRTYLKKLDHISEIIKEIGPLKEPPVVIGLCEIENEHVLQDLINHPNLKGLNYGFIHFNSSDYRGIDVALLYQKDRFVPIVNKRYATFYNHNGKTYKRKTRDQLWVNGLLDGESLHFIVNHWPSRRKGILGSERYRVEAAQTTLKIVKNIKAYDNSAKIIIMGDFNDNPNNKSIRMLIKYDVTEPKYPYFVNVLEGYFKKGLGTLVWKDVWHLFDQFLVSTPIFKDPLKAEGYFFVSSGVYTSKKLKVPTGRFKGYPNRTYNGSVYNGGYSDHFPIYLLLARAIQI